MSNENNYVPSPLPSDYKAKNDEAIQDALKLSKFNKRLLSAKDNETSISSPNSFKYFETTLFSTKKVTFIETSPSMLDPNFIESVRNDVDREYKVIRFDREHNIKSFDFTLTYNQIADWGADKFNSVPTNRTFIGSMIFTGCSNIKNTETSENIPLEAHLRFESVGDAMGNEDAVDGFGDNKGGPSITFKYSFTKDYIYLFVSSINPFRIIPKADGTFVDISYAEGRGLFIDEIKEGDTVKDNILTGSTKNIGFTPNKDIHCELILSVKDTSISSSSSEFQVIDINSDDFVKNEEIINRNAKTFTIKPTKGEIITYGMTASTDVDLEIASEVSPIKYTSRLLVKDMNNVNSFIEKLENLIKDSSTVVDEIPFVIKTIIREKSKYNARGDYFLDSQSDGFGKVLITEMGKYNAKLDTFEVVERVFDRDAQTNNEKVGQFKEYAGGNASPYLKKIIKNNPDVSYTRKTDKIMSLLRNVEFEEPDNLNAYSEISFIRSSYNFDCVKPFVELKSDNTFEDRIIYFNADRTVSLCNFKDYNMEHPIILHPFEEFGSINNGLNNNLQITDVVRVYDKENKRFNYKICSNLGLIFSGYYDDIKRKPIVTYHNAFDKDATHATSEIVTVVHQDEDYIIFSGNKGNVSIYNIKSDTMNYIESRLDMDEKILAVSYGEEKDYLDLKYFKSIKNKSYTDSIVDGKLNRAYNSETKIINDTLVNYTALGISNTEGKTVILYEVSSLEEPITVSKELWIETTNDKFVKLQIEDTSLQSIVVFENENPVDISKFPNSKNTLLFATNKRVISYDIEYNSWVMDIAKQIENTRYSHSKPGINDNTDNIPCATGFRDVSSIQIGDYRYYLSLRADVNGYVGVYKRVTFKTGEVLNLPKPSMELYKPTLITDGRYIYSIGGKVRNELDPTNPDEIINYIEKFDTLKNEWVKLPSDRFDIKDTTDEEAVQKRKLESFSGIALNNSIYIFNPKVILFNINTEGTVFTREVKYDNKLYKINIAEEGITTELSDIDLGIEKNIGLYPIFIKDDKVSIIAGNSVKKTVEGVTEAVFDRYDIHYITYDIKSNKFNIEFTKEIRDSYFDESYSAISSLIKFDFFDRSPICTNYEKVVAFAANGFVCINLNKQTVNYKTLYKKTTNENQYIENGDSLLESGEFKYEWKEVERNVENNINLSFVDNDKVIIIGGNTLRIPVTLDVSDETNISLYRTATTIPRVELKPDASPEERNDWIDTATFNKNNYRDYIRVVSTFGLKCESIGIAESNNHVFMMLKQKGYLTPAVYYLNKNTDKHFIWMRDAITSGNTTEKYYGNYKGFILGKYAIFYPETVYNKMENSYLESYSGTDPKTPIVLYDTETRNFGSIQLNEPSKNRIILYSEILNQAILVYENDKKQTKGILLIYDNKTNSIVTGENPILYTDTDIESISVLKSEWDNRQSILTGGSYGSKSYIVSSNGIAVFDFKDALNGKLSYKEFKDVFEDELPCKAVTQDSKYLYVSGGVNIKNGNEGHSLYKIALADIANNTDYLNRSYSFLNTETSSIFCPIYTTPDSLCVFGKMAYSDYTSRGVVQECKKKDIKFTSQRETIKIDKIVSFYNRYYPNIHNTSFNGHPVLLVYGGKQGLNTDITKVVDMYDISRRRWVSLPDLPVALTNANFVDNVIVGATKVNDDTTEAPYMHRIELVCEDFDRYVFKWVDTTFSTNIKPTRFVSTENNSKKRIALVGIDKDGYLLNSENSIYVFDNQTDDYLPEVIPPINLNSLIKYKVLSVYFSKTDELRLAIYNDTQINTTVDLWKYSNIDGWTIVKNNTISGLDISFSKIISSHEYFQGLVGVNSNSALVYAVESKLFGVFFTDDDFFNEELVNTKRISNSTKVNSFDRFETISYSIDGWISLFDTKENEFYIIEPCLQGFNTYTVYKNNKENRSSNVYKNKYNYIYDRDANMVVDSMDIKTGKITTLPVLIGEEPLSFDIMAKYMLCDDSIIAIVTKTNVKFIDILNKKELLTYELSAEQPEYNFENIIDIDYIRDSKDLYCTIMVNNSETIKSFIFKVSEGVALFVGSDTVVNILCNSVKLVYIGNDKRCYLASHNKSLFFVEYNNLSLVKRREYLYTSNAKIINEKNSEFYLYDTSKNISKVTKGFVDINDKENSLHYRSSVTDKYVNTYTDLLLSDDILYSIPDGIKVSLTNKKDMSMEYFNYGDDTLNRIFEIKNFIIKFTKIYGGPDGEDATYELSYYDKSNAHSTIKSTIVSKDPLDTIVDEIVLPMDTDNVYIDNIDNTDYVFTLSKEGLVSKINTLNGNMIRTLNLDLANGKFKTFDNSYHTIYIQFNNNTYQKFNTIDSTNELVILPTDINVSNLVSISKDEIKILGTTDEGISVEQTIKSNAIVYSTKLHNTYKDYTDNYAEFNMVVKKYDRCGENRLGTEISVTKTSDFIVSLYPNNILKLHSIKTGYEKDFETIENGEVAWISEVSSLLFIGYKSSTDDSLINIKAIKDNYDFTYSEKIFNIDTFTLLPKCCGDSLGITSDRHKDEVTSTYMESHIVFANNKNTNNIYELVLNYPDMFGSAYEAFDSLELKEFDLRPFSNLPDETIHKFHLVPSKNNSVIILGDSTETSKVVTFSKFYTEYNINTFNFDRIGETLFVYITMDIIYVGTTTSENSRGVVNAYELLVAGDGSLKQSKFIGNMVLPDMLIDIKDVVVEADNDRMPSIESVVTYCPVILFMDTIIPISEVNQSFIGTNYQFSSKQCPIKDLTPIKIKVEKGVPVVYFYSDNKPFKRMLKIGVKDRLITNKYMNYFLKDSDKIKHVYSDTKIANVLEDYTAEYYENLMTNEKGNDLVKTNQGKIVHIKNDDGTYTEFKSPEYPFNNEVIEKIFGYGKRKNKKEVRFLIFVDVKGNVSTYDRELKKFIDINGEVTVDIPYMSTEVKVLPSKITSEGNIAKRVWAYRNQNPYANLPASVDKISIDDPTLFDKQ